MKYYSAIQNNEILSFATKQTHLEAIRVSEISQSQKTDIIQPLIWDNGYIEHTHQKTVLGRLLGNR